MNGFCKTNPCFRFQLVPERLLLCAHVRLVCLSVPSVPSRWERWEEGIFQEYKGSGNDFIIWCFTATGIQLYKWTVLFCMAEEGFYSWQAAHNIPRIIKVSCSCRIIHIIIASGSTLICLGGGYYCRMCIHIRMEFESFHLDQNDIHRKGPWTIIPVSSLWVIK